MLHDQREQYTDGHKGDVNSKEVNMERQKQTGLSPGSPRRLQPQVSILKNS